MDNERILKRSLFGGFRREDVLNYIEKLQSENIALAEELRAKSAECSENGTLMDDYESARKETEELTKTIEALRAENEKLSKSCSEAAARANRNEAAAEELRHELDSIGEKYEALENEYAKATEDKSNALIQDAIRYSDSLVAGARKTADKVINDAHGALGEATGEIFAAKERIAESRRIFDESLSSVKENVDRLIESLSKCSSELSTGE